MIRRVRIVTPGRDHVTQQPGIAGRYLYERLTEKRFQQLCSAVLVNAFPKVRCFPVGQADGGRDAVLSLKRGDLIYQVKWASKRIQDPVSWLEATIRGEADNIRALVEKGALAYTIITSVAGTADPERGSMARLDLVLEQLSDEFGIDMACWWQADLDARVDLAPDSLKWAYTEMLAGHDLVRFLMNSRETEGEERRLYVLLRQVLSTQWLDDSKVKFEQVELDTHDLSSLFVDVEATRTALSRRAAGLGMTTTEGLGGAAAYLLATAQPFTLIRGEPGQGKSTLGQYVCQVHRAQYFDDDQLHGFKRPSHSPANPRLPLRIDLQDYAAWLAGGDPFTDSLTTPKRVKRPVESLETFLSDFLADKTGGAKVGVEDVQEIVRRFPVFLVLDGLDEIAQSSTRRKVVQEIDAFCARLSFESAPQVIVTTRPNASQLPEPSGDQFEIIMLARMDQSLRTSYLRRWATAQGLRGRDRRALERTFNSRSTEPYVRQLADNPMQLTILLFLMKRLGESVPASRTGLYASYMETFLARESLKSEKVREYRDDLEEVTAFLGWHLQSRAESDGAKARMSAKGIQSAINTYLFSVDKRTSHVADLFTAVTDRVWALTSKVDGTFEFDVQPMREYFAAKFLWSFVGADQPDFDSRSVFRELLPRPYWANTCRFYAGFARPNEVSDLVYTLEDQFDVDNMANQVRQLAWTLLGDGVFHARAKAEKRAAILFSDDLSVVLLSDAFDSSAEAPVAPSRDASEALAEKLWLGASKDPGSRVNALRIKLVKRICEDLSGFDQWWISNVAAATENKVDWIRLAIPAQSGARAGTEFGAQIDLSSFNEVCATVDVGFRATEGSALENAMVEVVMGGLCSDSRPTGGGFASDLLRACGPNYFMRLALQGDSVYAAGVGHSDHHESASQLQVVLARLRARDDRFSAVQAAMRFRRGQKGSVSPWGNTARALAAIFGPSWLSGEIAVIGAAVPDRVLRTGGNFTRESNPLGPEADYGRLVRDIRLNRTSVQWWRFLHDEYTDELSRALWVLGLVSVASPEVVSRHLGILSETMADLPFRLVRAVASSSSRLGSSWLRRVLPLEILQSVEPASVAKLLLAHHTLDPASFQSIGSCTPAMQAFGTASWPVSHSLSGMAATNPSELTIDSLCSIPSMSLSPDSCTVNISDVLLRRILREPGEFPSSWVIAADRQLTRRSETEPLMVVADSLGWFDISE